MSNSPAYRSSFTMLRHVVEHVTAAKGIDFDRDAPALVKASVASEILQALRDGALVAEGQYELVSSELRPTGDARFPTMRRSEWVGAHSTVTNDWWYAPTIDWTHDLIFREVAGRGEFMRHIRLRTGDLDAIWRVVVVGDQLSFVGRRTGPAPSKSESIKAAMRQLDPEVLRTMPQKEMEHRFGGARSTCEAARRQVLSELMPK